jgi:hypothetical protein
LRVRTILLTTFIILSNLIFAQQNEIQVNAKIVDENNNPVPFADIAFRRLQLGFLRQQRRFFYHKDVAIRFLTDI